MTDGFEIKDEENQVDQHIKRQVMDLRKQIDVDERRAYVERMSDPEIQYSRQDADLHWAVPVRQYLRAIKRLWTEDAEIQGATQYWSELELGTVQLVPPDKNGFAFSRVTLNVDPMDLKRTMNIHPRADLPNVRSHEFVGLNSVLKNELLSETWTITTDPTGPPTKQDTVTVSRTDPVPKHILENAVEAADAFLQQAELGFNVGMEPYMGTGEPL